MIKHIIFDLDGVLADTEKAHFSALNSALAAKGFLPINWEEHNVIYKGLATIEKLNIYSERRSLLTNETIEDITQLKKKLTESLLPHFCTPDEEKCFMLDQLQKEGYFITVCTNSSRNDAEKVLKQLAMFSFVDQLLTKDDVVKTKPDPEIYEEAIKMFSIPFWECLIVEDSAVGIEAAKGSGALFITIDDFSQLNYFYLKNHINELERIPVIIPAAGAGKRFAEAGYIHPKPLIEVPGTALPMIVKVLDMFENKEFKPYVVMQDLHVNKYNISSLLNYHCPQAELLSIEGLTRGSVETILKARPYIDDFREIIICNSDNIVDIPIGTFLNEMRLRKFDGGMITFPASEDKWSYARYKWTEFPGVAIVSEVAEKEVISDQATCGVYYFKSAFSFFEHCDLMIRNNIRVKNEFYLTPVFNLLIESGHKIGLYEIASSEMHGLGTPEDLVKFAQ